MGYRKSYRKSYKVDRNSYHASINCYTRYTKPLKKQGNLFVVYNKYRNVIGNL